MSTMTTYDVRDARSPLWTNWAGSLRKLDDGMTADAILAQAELGWQVEQKPLYVRGEFGFREVGTHVANVRADTSETLGIVGAGYHPVQNRQVLAVAEEIVAYGGARWLAAGSTRNGARVHALLQIDRDIRIGGFEDERLLPLLRVENGHDGGRALSIKVAPFRLACLNGMLVEMKGAACEWRARHTRRVNDGWLDEARRSLNLATEYYDRLAAVAERMLDAKVTEVAFEQFVRTLVPLPVQETPVSDRVVRNIETTREAIRTCWRADDLANIRGTAYGAYQAITAYVDYGARVNATGSRTVADARFERQVGGHALKDAAWLVLRELAPVGAA